MPCRDYESDVRYVESPINKDMKKKLDETTRLLCALMTKVESGYSISFDSIPGLAKWWEHHKEEDRLEALRVAAEEARRKKQKEDEIKSLEARIRKLRS